MLNYEMHPLFIEVGILKKKKPKEQKNNKQNKKRMGEILKKKEIWIRVS